MFRNAEGFHVFERQRQRGFARRGGEGDEKRLARVFDKAADRDSRDDGGGSENGDDDDGLRDVESRHQLAEIQQDADAFLSDGGGDGAENAEGREQHHVVGEAEHHFGERIAKRDYGRCFGSDGRAGCSEDECENYDLQHVAAGHRVDDAGGKDVFDHLGDSVGLRRVPRPEPWRVARRRPASPGSPRPDR